MSTVELSKDFEKKKSENAQQAEFAANKWAFTTHKYPLDLESNVELSHYVGFYISLPYHRAEDTVVTGGTDKVTIQKPSYDAVKTIRNYLHLTGDRSQDQLGKVAEHVAGGTENFIAQIKAAQKRGVKGEGLMDFIEGLAVDLGVGAANVMEWAGLPDINKGNIVMTHEAIMLYFPETLSTGYELDWQADSMRGTAILAQTISNALGSGNDKGFSMEGLGKALLGGAKNLSLNMIFGDIMSMATKAVQNPYMEMLFRGVQNRSLELSFKFTPRTEKEAHAVHRIITTFKKYGLPKVAGKGQIGKTYFAYPAEWDIIFYTVPKEGSMFEVATENQAVDKNNEKIGGLKYSTGIASGEHALQNRYISRYGRSVLESINVNYTPMGTPAFHRPDQFKTGAPPVETDITLRFKEIDLVTSDLVEHESLGF